MSLRIVYVSSCANGSYGLRRLIAAGIRPAQVVTISPEVAAKNRVSGYADLRPVCEAERLPVTVLDRYSILPEEITVAAPDLLLVNGWNRLVDAAVIERFAQGGLGVHAGHPPIGLGRAPLPWNLIKGMRDLEVYVFRLTPRADDGDIVGKCTVEITPFDDVQLLYEKVMYQAALLLEGAVRDAERDMLAGQPQNVADAVFYPKRTPEEGIIDFGMPVEAVYNFIRAQTNPYPGAFAFLGKERWTVWRAQPFDTFSFRSGVRRPGEIVAALPSGWVVQTGTSPLWILQASNDSGDTVPASLDELERYVGQRFVASSGMSQEK
jgi:methionyl-tRNA formyltransferase